MSAVQKSVRSNLPGVADRVEELEASQENPPSLVMNIGLAQFVLLNSVTSMTLPKLITTADLL